MTTYQEYEYAYPFKWWQFFSRAARTRRKGIALYNQGIRVQRPFWRFIAWTSWIWFFTNITVWMMFWIFTEVTRKNPQDWMFVYFLVYTAISCVYLLSGAMHGLVMRHWASSPKVKVGTSPLIPCGDLIVGGIVKTVGMRKAKDDPTLEPIPLEFINCGYVKRTQWGLTKGNRYFVVARANRKGAEGQACSGIMLGQDVYFIPAHAKWYYASDMTDWRLSVLVDEMRGAFGEDVTDGSYICDATDSFDWTIPNMPAPEPFTRRELYEAIAYSKRTGRNLGDWVQSERDTDRMRSDG